MKMFKSISGIYKIENKISKMFYIGSSTDCFRRFYQHINKLEKGEHINKQLQNAYNKYGKEFFTFEVVQEVIRPIGIITKEFQRLYLFPIEQSIIDSYDFEILYNVTKDARGYTDHMCNETSIMKCLNTRKSKRKTIYRYKYDGELLEEFKLISNRQNLTYNKIENDHIYDENLYSYKKLNPNEVAIIFVNHLKSKSDFKKKHIYDYFKIDIPKRNYKVKTGNPNLRKVIGYNRNGDKFEYESLTEACKDLSISGSSISDSIKNRVQYYSNKENITYSCKSIIWFDDLNKTFEDALEKFKLKDIQDHKNKLSRGKKIECISSDGEVLSFNTIKDATIFFFGKNNNNITNVLRGVNKTFNHNGISYIAKYI